MTLRLVLLVEGFAALALQILALRACVVRAGAAVPTSSIVIAGFLAALALGYHRGGRVPAAKARARAAANLVLAGAGVAASGWPRLLDAVFALGEPWGGPLAGAAALTVVLAMPLAYLLAEAFACLLAVRAGESRGGPANTLAWSTAGNVAGALVTALVLLHYFGAAAAGALAGSACAVAGLALSPRHRGRAAGVVGALVVGSVATAGETRELLFSTAYGDYVLVENARGRGLVVNRLLMGWASDVPPGQVPRPLAYVLRAEELFTEAGVRRVAVLGAGAMSFGRRGGLSPTFVDVDRKVARGARVLHGEAPPAGPLVVRDARAWLRAQAPGSLDGVFVDVFRARVAVPEHLLTRELFDLVHSRLAPDGALAFNVLRPVALDAYAYRLDRTLRTVFADCAFEWVSRPAGPGAAGSGLYWCRPHPLDGDLRVYRDATTLGGIEAAGL